MTDYRAFLRRQLLEDIYDRMSEEDKRMFVQMTLQNKSSEEIMQALQKQQGQLEEIKRRQNWAVDFGSDVAANLFTDSLLWLGAKLLKRL